MATFGKPPLADSAMKMKYGKSISKEVESIMGKSKSETDLKSHKSTGVKIVSPKNERVVSEQPKQDAEKPSAGPTEAEA